jgi:hypothetical protein
MNPRDLQALMQDGNKIGKDFWMGISDMEMIFQQLQTKVNNKAVVLKAQGKEVKYDQLVAEAMNEIEKEQKEQHERERAAVQRRAWKLLSLFLVFYALIPLAFILAIFYGIWMGWW